MNIKGTQKKNQGLSVNIFEQQEVIAKAEAIKANLKASTWHELESKGKFDKNEKLSFISDDMLILGCDIGSETHYVRAIDTRGRELSKSAFPFSNTLEGLYADIRRLSMFRDQLNEDRIRNLNRLHREMKIYFPGYKDAFGKIDGAASSKQAVKWFVNRVIELNEQLSDIENQLNQRCMEIPHAKNILAISGIGENTLSGILAEMGDISRFDDVKEIQKLSGLGLVSCSSGKHKGETKISHRGRKRLRYWLFQAAKSAVAHSDEFKELHVYYTTRRENPLKKMQSLIVIACKILRVIFTILTKGRLYDPRKLLSDIVRPNQQALQAA